jgi:hypothetical protein
MCMAQSKTRFPTVRHSGKVPSLLPGIEHSPAGPVCILAIKINNCEFSVTSRPL